MLKGVRFRGFLVAKLLCTVTACGASGSSDDAFECRRTDRHGTYAVHYGERAHKNEPTCGPLPDTLGPPDDPSAIIEPAWGACRVESMGWYNDDCYREVVYACSAAQGADTVGTSLAEDTIQKDRAGELIQGVLTRIVYQSNGSGCRSEYDITARRQSSE